MLFFKWLCDKISIFWPKNKFAQLVYNFWAHLKNIYFKVKLLKLLFGHFCGKLGYFLFFNLFTLLLPTHLHLLLFFNYFAIHKTWMDDGWWWCTWTKFRTRFSRHEINVQLLQHLDTLISKLDSYAVELFSRRRWRLVVSAKVDSCCVYGMPKQYIKWMKDYSQIMHI